MCEREREKERKREREKERKRERGKERKRKRKRSELAREPREIVVKDVEEEEADAPQGVESILRWANRRHQNPI